MKKSLLLFIAFFSISFVFAQDLSPEEQKLYNAINEYRAEKNLPAIPLSKSLTVVAQTHAKDLQDYPPKGKCNMHSWSSHGDWTPCCYTPDHAQAQCMWDKPRELTSYTGNGYEISYWNSAGVNADNSLVGWQKSKHHNNVIINKRIWKDTEWKAMGVGIYKNYAVVWFGKVEDISE